MKNLQTLFFRYCYFGIFKLSYHLRELLANLFSHPLLYFCAIEKKRKKENYTKNIDISIKKKKKKINEKRNEAWESQSGSGALRDRQAHREAVVQPQGIRVRFVLAYARMRALIPTAGSFIETHVIESDGATSRSGDNRVFGGGTVTQRGCCMYGVWCTSEKWGEGWQLFNASAGKENEVAAEFSFSHDISLPLPVSFSSAPLSFSVCLSLCFEYRIPCVHPWLSLFDLSSGRVRAYF